MIYTNYCSDQNNITSQSVRTRIFPRRFLLKSSDDLHRIISEQKSSDDIFITKYSNDETVNTVILDFDGADRKEEVYKEVRKVHYFLRNRGVNSVIVSSTNKGFHFYIQIPPTCFDKEHTGLDRSERNKLFVLFTKNIIKADDFRLVSLDETNTNAGLGGNIRLLGSIHPKTHEKVHTVLGDFLDLNDKSVAQEYYRDCEHYVQTFYNASRKQYEVKQELLEKRIKENNRIRLKNKNWKDPIRENDLRELLPQMYGGTVKKYGSYIFMQCPWHTDRKPSCKVTKEWFYCTGCGAKGNIWTLIKSGEFKWNTQ